MAGFLLMAVFLFALAGPYDHYWRDNATAPPYIVLYALTFFSTNLGPNTSTFILPSYSRRGFGQRERDRRKVEAGYMPGIGMMYALVILGAISLVGLAVTYLFTPETMGRSLEENESVRGQSQLLPHRLPARLPSPPLPNPNSRSLRLQPLPRHSQVPPSPPLSYEIPLGARDLQIGFRTGQRRHGCGDGAAGGEEDRAAGGRAAERAGDERTTVREQFTAPGQPRRLRAQRRCLHVLLTRLRATQCSSSAASTRFTYLSKVSCNPQGGVRVVQHQLRSLRPHVLTSANRDLPRHNPQTAGQQLALREHDPTGRFCSNFTLKVCGSTPCVRNANHLFLELPLLMDGAC
ncbi:hypothetical protein EJB05_44985, partial [Eragrostis curvula]